MAIEGGRTGITLDAILDIADALKVPPAWLFSDDWTLPAGWLDGEPSAPPPHP